MYLHLVIGSFLGLFLPAGVLAESMVYEAHVVKVITHDCNNVPLGYPASLFFDENAIELYVVHSGEGSKVAIYGGVDYFPTLSLGDGRGLSRCSGVFMNKEGSLFAAKSPSEEGEKSAITVYDGAFFKVRDIPLEGFPNDSNFVPRHIVQGTRDRLILAGNNYPGALVFDREGRFLHIIAPKDTVRGGRQEADIVALTTDQEGKIYLLSEGMGRVYVYDREERFLHKFGEKGGSSGKLARARGVAVDGRARKIYVVDYLRHGVNVYDMEGNFVFEFGGQGVARGWFSYPTDIVVDAHGRVVVADLFNKRVQVFEISQR